MDEQIGGTANQEYQIAKLKRDLVRDRIVTTLKFHKLPDELAQLLVEDDAASADLWVKYALNEQAKLKNPQYYAIRLAEAEAQS